MILNELKKFIKNNKWEFAKSMANIPHEYIIKDNVDIDIFYKFVKYIRDNGIKAYFWRKQYIYLEIDGYYYWTMGNPLEQTKIINRASLEKYKIIKYEHYNVMEILK